MTRYFKHHRTHSLNRALLAAAPIIFLGSLVFFLVIRGSAKFEPPEEEPIPQFPPEIVSTENEAYFADSEKLAEYKAQLQFLAESASRWLELERRLSERVVYFNFSDSGHYVAASSELSYRFVDISKESLELRDERQRVEKLRSRLQAELARAQGTPAKQGVYFRERISDELPAAKKFLRGDLARLTACLCSLETIEKFAADKTRKSHINLNRTLHEKGYRELSAVAFRQKN